MKARPHTEEWFDTLRKLNPPEVFRLEELFAMAGSRDVCGICGSQQAADYERLGLPQGNCPGTFKLCADCVDIQQTLHGVTYAPLTD